MKQMFKRVTALMCVVVLVSAMFAAPAAAATDNPPKVFTQTSNEWKDHRYYYDGRNGSASFAGSACGVFSLVNAIYYLNGS